MGLRVGPDDLRGLDPLALCCLSFILQPRFTAVSLILLSFFCLSFPWLPVSPVFSAVRPLHFFLCLLISSFMTLSPQQKICCDSPLCWFISLFFFYPFAFKNKSMVSSECTLCSLSSVTLLHKELCSYWCNSQLAMGIFLWSYGDDIHIWNSPYVEW